MRQNICRCSALAPSHLKIYTFNRWTFNIFSNEIKSKSSVKIYYYKMLLLDSFSKCVHTIETFMLFNSIINFTLFYCKTYLCKKVWNRWKKGSLNIRAETERVLESSHCNRQPEKARKSIQGSDGENQICG